MTANSVKPASMKPSKKYVGGTLAVIGVLIAMMVLYSRFAPLPETPADSRVPASEELAALRDFTRIVARGDFVLAVDYADEFSVVYTPGAGNGYLRVEQQGDTLTAEGFGHRGNLSGVLRISMPMVTALELELLQEVSVTGFSADLLEINASQHERLRLEANRLGTLSLDATGVRELELIGNTIGAREFLLRTNDTRISETD